MIRLTQEDLSTLIGDIYDCALDPAGWTPVMTRINGVVDGAYSTIGLGDLTWTTGVMAAHSPWDPDMLHKLNVEYGMHGVPGLREVAYGPIDVPLATMQVMSEEEFRKTTFYLNWVMPQGLREGCTMKFVQTGDRVGIFAMITRATRGLVTSDEREFIALMSPHLRRAAMIGDMLNQTRMEASFFRSALDSVTTPVVLVAADGSVIEANGAGDALLSAGSPIALRNGKLAASNPFATEALLDAIARTSRGDSDIGSRGIGIPLAGAGGPPAVAYVLPVSASAVRESLRPATAAIFISIASTYMPPPQDALVSLFHLTPMEVRVLLAVGAGATPAEAAPGLGIGEHTVKSHLSRVFSKTGTTRQAELVRLMAGLAPA